MNTWISKASALMGCALLLAGCEPASGTGGFGFLQSGSGGLFSPAAPVRSTVLADGNVTLVAPDGYCIDARSQRATFALMARCDRLGEEDANATAEPVALITATLTPAGEDVTLDAADIVPAGFDVVDRLQRDTRVVVRVVGTPPEKSFHKDHWRGAAEVNGYVLGLALYTDAEMPPLGPYGRLMLDQSLSASQTQSRKTNSEPE